MEAVEEFDDLMNTNIFEVLNSGLWDGRFVSRDQISECEAEIAGNIFRRLASCDPNSLDFQQNVVKLARIGADPATSSLLERDIQQLNLTPDGVMIQTGFGKSISKFWKKHKTEILIGIAVVAVVTAIVVVAACAGGTLAGAAAAAGGSFLDEINNDKQERESIAAIEPLLEIEEPLEEDVGHSEEWERLVYGRSSSDLPTYAESFLEGDPDFTNPAPFDEIALRGSIDQSTVHFHCGINNCAESITEARDCLYETLEGKMAVQPHLIHNDSLAHGLAMVQLKQLAPACKLAEETTPSFVPVEERSTLPLLYLKSSHIQKSIDYEKERLGHIADEILSLNNPKLKQAHVTFSNGGYVFKEALKELTPEQRSTVVVIALGTTEIIEDSLACKAYNVIGDKDWPSKACIGGMAGIEKKSKAAKIEIIHQEEMESVIGGHYFLQPDYQDKIGSILNEISSEYDVY